MSTLTPVDLCITNITQPHKCEPQASHFDKEQCSLHCTVKYTDSGNKYLYHLSDDKKHDFAFTSSIVQRLINHESENEASSFIRIKSDNCSAQYKCKTVFNFYHNFSKEKNKTIIVYYGAAGHGKGLVDAMSAFGVKTPLKRAVIEQDL